MNNFQITKANEFKAKPLLYMQNVQTCYKVNTMTPQLLRFMWGKDDEPVKVVIDVNLEQDGVDPDKIVDAMVNTWSTYKFDPSGIKTLKERCNSSLKKLDLT